VRTPTGASRETGSRGGRNTLGSRGSRRSPWTSAAPASPTAETTATGYAKARAARELYQAQLVKLELDRQLGTLVRADEVKVAAFNSARKARDQLIALPNRVAAIIAATDDTEEVRRILDEEIEKIST
jgi:hypothetical protein